MEKGKRYYLCVRGMMVEVSKGIYRAYYQSVRHAKHLLEQDRKHDVIQYSALDTSEMSGEECIPDTYTPKVEDAAIQRIMWDNLRAAMLCIPDEERELLQALYFEGISERQYTQRTGIPQKTVNDCRRRALNRLKKFLENKNKSAQPPSEIGLSSEGDFFVSSREP